VPVGCVLDGGQRILIKGNKLLSLVIRHLFDDCITPVQSYLHYQICIIRSVQSDLYKQICTIRSALSDLYYQICPRSCRNWDCKSRSSSGLILCVDSRTNLDDGKCMTSLCDGRVSDKFLAIWDLTRSSLLAACTSIASILSCMLLRLCCRECIRAKWNSSTCAPSSKAPTLPVNFTGTEPE
jgi:hypothetical protein